MTEHNYEFLCPVPLTGNLQQVFEALSDPQALAAWFAEHVEVEPRVGGDYGFGFSFEMDGKTIKPPPMKILEFVENKKLTITWPDWRMDPEVPDQTVSWILEDLKGKTRLTLLHTGFTRTVDVSDYPFGWWEFMDKIRDVAQSL